MNRHKNLYDDIASWPNLLRAARGAQRGKRFNQNVSRFNFNLETELLTLQGELRDQTYQPGPYFEFHIYEPKKRLISAAPYRDRVVHHALCNVIGPPFEATLIDNCFACRIGKGQHKAADRFTQYARRYPYVLKCDIRKYFPSLKLHQDKCQVYPVDKGVEFVGYRIFPTHRLLKRASAKRGRRRLAWRARQYRDGEITQAQLRQCVMSWLGHAKQADTWGWRRKVLCDLVFVKG